MSKWGDVVTDSGRLEFPDTKLGIRSEKNDHATVVVQIDSFTFDALSDMPASFGPEIPNEGISGLLVVADPDDACSVLQTPDFVEKHQPWIALISRSQGRESDDCTFDIKVRNAEKAGAIAAIVYDDIYENLIIMAKPAHHPDPSIPAVFVSQKSGMLLEKLYAPGYTQIYISAMSDMVWMSMIISTLAGFFAVSVVVTAFYLARRPVAGMGGDDGDEEIVGAAGGGAARRAVPQGLNAEQLRLLPVIVHQAEDSSSGNEESRPSARTNAAATASTASTATGAGGEWHTAGDTKRVCAICLELYEPNDKLRLLPCEHRYHKECVDQWLTTRRPLCPICKHDATAATSSSTAAAHLDADLEAGEGSSGIRFNWNRTRGIFSEAGARENIRRAAQRVLESRFLSWARPGNTRSAGETGSSTSNNSSGVREGERSGEEARVRLLPLADNSSQRTGNSVAVQIEQHEPSSTSVATNV